jgi:hypothetical protein
MSTTANFTGSLFIGQMNGVEFFSGYMDEIRVQKSNIFSANPSFSLTNTFTLPSSAYTRSANVEGGIDTYSKLLLHGDKINNETVRAITFNGNAAISTSIKKFGTSSLSLDGTNSYLTMADNAAFTTGTSDFTWDFWTYFTTIPSTWSWLSQGNSNTSTQLWLFDSNNLNNSIRFYVEQPSTVANYQCNYTFTTGTWYHMALVRQGGEIFIFVNGVAQQLTVSTAISSSTSLPDYTGNMIIGARSRNVIDYFFPGYIEEVRFSKGIARWTSNFTPPTAPHTADEFTSLLLHFDDANAATSTTDSSGGSDCSLVTGVTNKLVTYSGNAKVSTTQSKFGNASINFDGTNSYLTIPNQTDFQFGTGDFTVDAWVRWTDNSKYLQLFSLIVDGNNQFQIYVDPLTSDNSPVLYVTVGGVSVAWYYVTSISFNLNQWYHLAWVRNGSTVKIFVNGVSQSLTTMTAVGSNNLSVTGAGSWYTGSNNNDLVSSHYFAGYVEELRVSKGIARWTSDFTPPTNAYTNIPVVITRRPSAKGIIVV